MTTTKNNSAAFAQTASRGRRAARATPAPPPPGTVERRKYTVRLDPGPADAFDQTVLELMATVGRRVDKSEAMRVLADLLAQDDSVRNKVISALKLSA